MEREKISELDERDFVTSLIMSNKCCQVLIPFIRQSYFTSDYTRIVVSWVVEYYKKFNVCPKDDITSLYRSHHDEIDDQSTRELVSIYLTKLAESKIPINNEDYLLDRSKNFLDYKALTTYTEDLNACLAVKDMDKARKIQDEYRKVQSVEINEVDLLSPDNQSVIEEALAKTEEELFTLPDNLSNVFGKIHRNDFISILAGMKKGKTWALLYLATEAMKQGLNVIFVSMEMTREEVVQRVWKMLFGAKSGIIPEGKYETTKFMENADGTYDIKLYDVNVKPNSGKTVKHLQKQARASANYSGNLKIIAYPAFSASVKDITRRVEELAKDGYIADVLDIDYADITQPIGGGSEVRNQLDLIWKHLRGFSMKFHCATITASQTNRSGLNSSVVDATTTAEDIRKVAHITSMVSLEQTPAMYKKHIMRMRNVAMRNGESSGPCVFPQALGLGQFVFGKPIPWDKLNVEEDDGSED